MYLLTRGKASCWTQWLQLGMCLPEEGGGGACSHAQHFHRVTHLYPLGLLMVTTSTQLHLYTTHPSLAHTYSIPHTHTSVRPHTLQLYHTHTLQYTPHTLQYTHTHFSISHTHPHVSEPLYPTLHVCAHMFMPTVDPLPHIPHLPSSPFPPPHTSLTPLSISTPTPHFPSHRSYSHLTLW